MIGPWFVNWNDYKATFEAEAEKIVGQPVRVVGSASATLLPAPSLTFENVSIGDVDGKPMMTVDRFEVTVELMPMLQGQFRITSMRLDRPKMRIRVDDGGRLDWQARNEASKTLDPEKVILDRLEIVDGIIDYSDPAGETNLTFEGVNAVVEARSLLGPWRIEGSYLDDGVAVPFRFATGRRLDDGSIRVKTDLSPAGWPVALAVDGVVGTGDDGLYYDGTYNLTQIVPAAGAGGDDGSAGGDVTGWRSEGKFRLTRRQLAITQAILSEGPPDRPYSVAGSLTVDLGAKPRFEAHASARQIDLDRSLGKGPSEPVDVPSAASSLVGWLTNSFVPPIPGRVFFQVPGIVVGGSVIQNVSFEASPTIGGWRLASFQADLPGRARLEARGMLATDFEIGFAGNVRLVVNQPALFATWWRGKSLGGAGRLLSPFEIVGRAELSPQKFVFEDVDATFGQSAIRGRFAWTDLTATQHRRVVEAKLDADTVDFTQLRAFAELVAGKDLANTAVIADSYDIKLSAHTLQFEGVAMRDVAVDASYADDALTVNEFSVGDLGGAHINVTQGRIESLSDRPRGHLDAQLEAETLDAFVRVVGRVLPDHPFSKWLASAGPSLAPAFLTASIEAPAKEGDADISVKLSGTAASTNLSAAVDLSGSLADWRHGNAGVEVILDSPNAAELARQAGMQVGGNDDPGATHLQINADGVPADGLDTRITGEFAGVGLRSSGRLTLAAGAPPAYAGSLAAASDDIEPLLRMIGLGVPVAALGNSARIDGDITVRDRTAEVALRNSQVADRLVNGRLTLARDSDDGWAIDGNLNIDAVDLSWFTALGLGFAIEPTDDPSAPWSRAPFGETGFGQVSGTIAVSTDDLGIAPGFDATAATLTVGLQPNRLSIDLGGSQTVGGSMSGGLSIYNVGGNARVAGRIDLKGATLEQLVWSRSGRAVATGEIDISANFEAAGRSPTALVSSLTGGGAIAIRDGEARYVNPQAARLVIRASDLGQEFTENELRDAFAKQIDGGNFSFKSADGAFAIAAGAVRLKSLTVKGEDLSATGDAVVDLTQMTIDSDWTVTFDPGDDQVEGTVPQVGIVFRGPLATPERIIDVLQFGSYLNIRKEERLLELLSQAEADRLEAERLNREKRKLREDSERRARKAAEAEAARIAAEAEAKRKAAEEAARRSADEADRIAAEVKQRRAAAEAAAQNVVDAKAARDTASNEAEQHATEVEQLRQAAKDAAAKAAEENAARTAAETAMREAADTAATQKRVSAEAAQADDKAERRLSAAEEAASAAREEQSAQHDAEQEAVAAVATIGRQQGDAEIAAAAAAKDVKARTVAESDARDAAAGAERRRQAADQAAQAAADEVKALIEAASAAERSAEEAAQQAADAQQRHAAAEDAAGKATAKVARLSAEKDAADKEVKRTAAEALRKLGVDDGSGADTSSASESNTGGQPVSGVTSAEASRINAQVALARSAANLAGKALAEAEDAEAAAKDEAARLAADAERLRAAAAQAANKAAEEAATRNAAEDGLATAKANAATLAKAAAEAARTVDAATSARVAAENEAARMNAEVERLGTEAAQAADKVKDAKAARAAADAAVADREAEVERLRRIAQETAGRATDEKAALDAAAADAARLEAEAKQQSHVATNASSAASDAKAKLKAAEDEAARLAAEAERLRLAAEEAIRKAKEAADALQAAEAEAARVSAEAEKHRLAAEEATRKALEVSVPR